MSELNKIALKLISNGKGILAADESNGTMTKRLEAVNLNSTPENRLLFRETLFHPEYERMYWWSNSIMMKQLNKRQNLGYQFLI